MELKNFVGIHSDEKILVLGNGMSILKLPKSVNVITIGVNDIDRYISPTYLVLTDDPDRFGLPGTRRRMNIEKTKARHIFVSDKRWVFSTNGNGPQMYRRVFYKLGSKGKLNNILSDSTIDYSICSPFVAICLAIKMGSKNIGILGVDFTEGHFYAEGDGQHTIVAKGMLPQVETHFKVLYEYAKENNIELWNLSEESILTAIPKKKLQDFLC